MTRDQAIYEYILPACSITWNDKICEQVEDTLFKKGEWIAVENQLGNFRCSNCQIKASIPTVMYKPTWKYCPNCGAKMGKE